MYVHSILLSTSPQSWGKQNPPQVGTNKWAYISLRSACVIPIYMGELYQKWDILLAMEQLCHLFCEVFVSLTLWGIPHKR